MAKQIFSKVVVELHKCTFIKCVVLGEPKQLDDEHRENLICRGKC